MIGKIALNVKHSLIVVDIKDIIYFEKEKKYIKVILRNQKKYILKKVLNIYNLYLKKKIYTICIFLNHIVHLLLI